MANIHLGSLGTPRGPVDITFDYFGQTIRAHPDASDLQFIDLLQKAASVELDEANMAKSLQAMDVVLDTIRQQIHPDDWDLFWRTARANRQNTLDLMALSERITEAAAGFPTGLSSDSAHGRHDTQPKPEGDSSSPARQRDQGRALQLLHGRPDLQMAVVLAEEARQAA